MNGVLENRFYNWFHNQSFKRSIEASPVLSKQMVELDKRVMLTGATEGTGGTGGMGGTGDTDLVGAEEGTGGTGSQVVGKSKLSAAHGWDGCQRKSKLSAAHPASMKWMLDVMEQWAEANLEELRSRKRNDRKEEQTCVCFKAKLRTLNGVEERRFTTCL